MKTLFPKKARKLFSTLGLGVMLLGLMAQTASAAILFQDDTFNDVESDAIRIGSNDAGARNTAIQFGNDASSSENGKVQWNISTNRFSVDHPVDVTGDLTTTNGISATGGQVDFHNAAGVRLRESSNPTTSAACTTVNELIVNTSLNRIEICTATGSAGSATWTALPAGNASSLGGFTASEFLRSDASSNLTSGTLTTNSGTTLAVNGVADFSGASQFKLRQGSANPGTCSVGELFYNTTTNIMYICTATNTWSGAGSQDFEGVYNTDADKTLTTSNGNFSIAAGTGTYNETAAASNITGSGASATAINLNASNAAGGITGAWGTGGLNFSSSTGAFSISGTGNSTLNATSGNLNLTTTTSGNIALSTAGSGKTVTFQDANLSSPIKFNNSQTALSSTFTGASDNGILDALNGLTSTSSGQGASLVGVNNTFTNITGTNVQSVLSSIDSKIGTSAPNVDTLAFNPQYPNYVISRSGSNNNGTLIEDFDSTNNRQYYRWTSDQATQQNIDVKFRFSLPSDFVSTGNFTFDYRTGTTTTANNKATITFKDITKSNTVCATSSNNASANAWTTVTVTSTTLNTGCTGGNAMAAGDVIELDANLFDISDSTASGTFADVGQMSLAYNN